MKYNNNERTHKMSKIGDMDVTYIYSSSSKSISIALKHKGFLHGFETGWGNPYTSCGTSVLSPRVSVANEGDMTEVPQRVYGWPIQSKPCWNPFLTCFQLISNENTAKMQQFVTISNQEVISD